MSAFQAIVLGFFAVLSMLTVSAGLRGVARKRIVVFWLLVWNSGAVAMVWPRSVVLLARALGIGRGADLLLYVSVLVMLAGFFYVYTRFRRLDRQLTQLVRRLAIEDARPPQSVMEPGAQLAPSEDAEPRS
jgi:small membrane protein